MYYQPSSDNTFVPRLERGLTIAYSRNIKDFGVNRYTKIRNVDRSVGLYTRINSTQAVRANYVNGLETAWRDGADRPTGTANREMFSFDKFATQRYSHNFSLGQKSIDQADFALQQIHQDMIGVQAMTQRTILALGALGVPTALAVNGVPQTSFNWGINEASVDGGRSTGGTGGAGTAVTTANVVTSITVTNPGSGYNYPPAVTFTGGGGTGAAATANVANGVITGFTVTAGGTGYTSTPTVVLAATGGGPATSILSSGQNWVNGTPQAPNILASLNYALKAIMKRTAGAVRSMSDLVLVLGPDLATALGQSQELRVFMMQQAGSEEWLTGINKTNFGIPPNLYGLGDVVIESSVVGTSLPSMALSQDPASDTSQEPLQFIMGGSDAYLVARPGGLQEDDDQTAPTPSMSTLTGFFYEEMTTQVEADAWNRRVKAAITSDYVYQLTSPSSGFHFAHCTG